MYFCKKCYKEIAKTKQGSMNNFEKILTLAIGHCEQCLYSYCSLPHDIISITICSMDRFVFLLKVLDCRQSRHCKPSTF